MAGNAHITAQHSTAQPDTRIIRRMFPGWFVVYYYFSTLVFHDVVFLSMFLASIEFMLLTDEMYDMGKENLQRSVRDESQQ